MNFKTAAIFAIFAIATGFVPNSHAYVGAPTINPPHPTTNTPITVFVQAGGCHAFVNDEGEPQLARNENQLDLIAPGIASLAPGHPFCINQNFNYPFPIGTLPAGNYTLRILILDSGYPDTPFPFGSISFNVSAPATVPSLLPGGLSLLVTSLFVAGSLTTWRRTSAQP